MNFYICKWYANAGGLGIVQCYDILSFGAVSLLVLIVV